MSNIHHYLETGAVYFVTSNTKNREKLFAELLAARFLLVCISYHKFILDFKLFGYVIMPEHFHFLIQPSEKYNLSVIMRFIKGNFARKYNGWKGKTELIQQNSRRDLSPAYLNDGYVKKRARYQSVWQERFYETAMRNENDIFHWLEYMHNNPVKKGLVGSPAEYEFSSYSQYYGQKRRTVQIPIDPLW